MDRGPEAIARYLAGLGGDAERRSDAEWVVRVPCAMRGPLAVGVRRGERTLSLRAFYMRGPDRNHERVYRRLMRKHLEMRAWRFALDDAGDIFMVAEAPLETLSGEELDGLLGACGAYADETWEGVMRAGFEVPAGTVFGPPRPRG